MLEHIKAYFDRFGTKSCCYEDLQPYVNAVMSDVETIAGFVSDLRTLVHLDAEGVCIKDAHFVGVYATEV